ncbi:molybdenum cofactor biosynthesis protein MoaE [Acetobacter sp. AN02]|uniref:molybdenum cofactor biosynthesis protein MoaE n=1 Tax=Acetobacter sp. AN02 TaxID=2894186 RepID=UPI00243433CB|nr:molybdenum cofactor biosynthesis protein MoaE [Acetobacter sp. AN02]MDG6095183.1 molybdenum cofactor biosynthesis protein MoaE [Acetobacter sp. AN02]
MASVRILVSDTDFDTGQEISDLLQRSGEGAGGLGAFVGVVRGGSGLQSLTLEHYPGMTERILEGLVLEAVGRFSLSGCTVIHRVGCMNVGERIVLVLTASAHRAEALDAVRFLIDRLKTGAPFWKKEHYEDGAGSWVDAREADDWAAARWDTA